MEKTDLESPDNELSAVEADSKWGYVDRSGAWVIEPRFKAAYDVLDGKVWVNVDGKWGNMTLDEKWIIEPAYDDVWCWDYDKGLIRVKIGAKYGYIDHEGAMDPQSDI